MLYPPAARIAEISSALLIGAIIYYCFSNLTNPLAWVILPYIVISTLWYGGKYLLHRHKPTTLLWEYAGYVESGTLDAKRRQRMEEAANALEGPFDYRKAAAQVLRLQEVVRTIEHDFMMPAMDNTRAQLAYLQGRILNNVLAGEGTPLEEDDGLKTNDPEIRAIMNLARAKRALRGLPTQLVVADLNQMRDVYRAVNELGAEGEKFLLMTARMSKKGNPSGKQPRDPYLEAARIFDDAFHGVITKAEAWKRFDEARKKLEEEAQAGGRSKEDVERDIENLRDLLTRRLEEIDV